MNACLALQLDTCFDSKRGSIVSEALDAINWVCKRIKELVIDVRRHICCYWRVDKTDTWETIPHISVRSFENGTVHWKIEVISINSWFRENSSWEWKPVSQIDWFGIIISQIGVDFWNHVIYHHTRPSGDKIWKWLI